MGKSSKNKGPKGKIARRAAKLERHWGERADEDEMKKARIRKGKSRLMNAPSRMKSKPRSTEKRLSSTNTAEEIEDIAESENEYMSSDDESVENFGGEGLLLNSLLNNIRGGPKSSRKDAMVSEDEFSSDGDSITSDSDGSQSVEDGNASFDEMETIEFDFEGMKAKGPNPYLDFFSKDPRSEQDLEQTSNKLGMKRMKCDNLDENIVIQASAEVKTKYALCVPEQSHAMDAFSHVRKNIVNNWAKVNMKALHKDSDASGKTKSQPIFSELQAAIYPMVSNYCDAQITCMNRENRPAIENMLILHVLNHVLTANHDITSHNNQLRELEKRDEIPDTEEFRDQGYTRPKVLILLPTKSTAYDFTKAMLKILGDKCSIENEEKFDEEYGPMNFEEDDDKVADKRRRAVQKAKGKEWSELFGDGVNSDDDFKIGISMSSTKKKGKKQKPADAGVTVKLFSDFYHSDIILASPIGLKMITNDEDDGDEEDVDIDFLSSIEVMIVHQSDVLLMQNWDHMGSITERLNQQPKKSTGIDFSRVRNYLLSGQASHWRQTIIVSRFIDPHVISTFNRCSGSLAGKIKVRRKVPNDDASICNVLTKVRQVFQRVHCDSIATQSENKVKYFKDTILPQLIRTKQDHTLIYIPSYFDFFSVRNILLKNEIASHHFVSVTEYARVSEVSRGRARFLQGEKRIMLYTGRAHFFMRHHIKGAKHLILLGLPENAEFYPELLNMLSSEGSNNLNDMIDIDSPVSCMNLFTRYDAQCLERIVGTKHSERMVKSQKSTFLFNS